MFYVMWLPAILCFFIVGPWMPLWVSVTTSVFNNSTSVSVTTNLTPWSQQLQAWWTGGQWSHLQGLVTSIVITSKPDIFEAVKEALHIVTCGLLPLQGTTAKNAASLENGRDKGTPEQHSQNTRRDEETG